LSRRAALHVAHLYGGVVARALILTLIVTAAWAQSAQNPNSPAGAFTDMAPPAPEPDSNPAFRPGFIHQLGRWIGEQGPALPELPFKGPPDLPPLKSPQEVLGSIGSQATGVVRDAAGAAEQATGVVKGAAGAVQEATGVIVGLPTARIVTGRQRCPDAPNGAPDCTPAAQALCKGKGFEGGKGLEIKKAQRCPTWMWLSSRVPSEGECPLDTFVTRAVCQ
jgi:hypothetical protein